MPEDQAKALVRSLEKFDIVEPLVIDQKNRIVGGHQRLDALILLGVKSVPVIRKTLTEREFKALNLALNRISGDWDEQKLAPLLAELKEFPEIDLTGFQPAEIDKLIREVMPEQEEEDAIPEPPVEPTTKLGDLWQLGEHRVLCGDSTKPENIELVLGGSRVDAIITDPPWGVGWEYEGNFKDATDNNLEKQAELLHSFLLSWIPKVKGGGFIFVWQSMKRVREFYKWFAGYDWSIFAECQNFVQVVPKAIQNAVNPIVYFRTTGEEVKVTPMAGRRDYFIAQTSIVREKDDLSRLNTAARPLDSVSYLVENFTNQSVADPFLGSGTTLIAAQQLGRTCYGIEIEPRYVDVCVKRWENLTGKKGHKVDANSA